MVRERYRAQVEMARFAAEASWQGTISATPLGRFSMHG
jgi:hypothetical protein